jgi:uncharacterized membrane protein
MQHDRFPAAPGFLIGVALAGLFDGIVLHQILQWHHMICVESHCVSKTVASLQRATFYDGLFHAVMWVVLLLGLGLLTRAIASNADFSRPRFWGSVLLGAGIFNVVEGIVDHQMLQIHHVRFGPGMPAWDVGFLIVSAILALVGWGKLRRGQGRVAARPVV